MNKQHIALSDTERSTLEHLLSHGTLSARKFKRATALLELDRGKTLAAVAATLQANYNTIAHWRDRFIARGLDCLDEAPRSGRPVEIDGEQRAKITALAYSDAPEGHTRWSLRLLADKAVESGLCDHITHSVVGELLKKTN